MRINIDELELHDDQSYWYDNQPFSGIACYYNEKGQLESEVEYNNGIKDGVERDYYSNGLLEMEAEIKNSVYHGTCKKWDANGNKKCEEYYEHGILIRKYDCNKDGKCNLTFELRESDPNFALLKKFRESAKY